MNGAFIFIKQYGTQYQLLGYSRNYWMSSHLLLSYEPTDYEHVCCLDCLSFSIQDVSLYQQYLFYVHSLLESSKTVRCIAFGWSLKKYQVPICLLSSCDIVRAQHWGTGSHMATHCSQQDRGLTSQGLSHHLQRGLRRQLGVASTARHQTSSCGEDGDVLRLA